MHARRGGLPVNPKIIKVRHDVMWEDVVVSQSNEKQYNHEREREKEGERERESIMISLFNY